MPSRNAACSLTFAATVLLLGSVLAYVLHAYLRAYPLHDLLAAGTFAATALLASVGTVHLLRAKTLREALLPVALVLFVALLPLASMPINLVTFASFGLTVYGLVPVPVLDITVDSRGFLWFRDKTHTITRDDIVSLLAPDVQVVVIGVGWRGAARLEPPVPTFPSCELRVLSTPDAVALFNALVSSGKRVVLLLHSTC